MHKYQTLIDALALEPTSALFTHPRDDNKWKENERPDASVLVEALRKIQYKAVSLGDAQVIALEALAAPTAPAQVPTDPNQCDVCGAQRKS